MIVDAVVLAGGRSSRLGGVPKSGLVLEGQSLLEASLDAVRSCRRTVVVGDSGEAARHAPKSDATVVREEPPFSGPAAAIAAGVAALAALAAEHQQPESDFTVVIACDMPRIGTAIGVVLSALDSDSDGAVATDEKGVPQLLAGVYRTSRLRASADAHAVAGDLVGLSVRALVADLNPAQVLAPARSTDDIDSWADAERFGIAPLLAATTMEDK